MMLLGMVHDAASLLATTGTCSLSLGTTHVKLIRLTERLLTVCCSTVWTSAVVESRTNRRSKKKEQQQLIRL